MIDHRHRVAVDNSSRISLAKQKNDLVEIQVTNTNFLSNSLNKEQRIKQK